MQANSIEEVVKILDHNIEQQSVQKSRLAYFAALYRRMTLAVLQHINDGFFKDSERMKRLDVVFANRYFTAYFNWIEQKKCSRVWSCAFEAASSTKPIVLQHLLLGINAHINLDLGLAAAEVAGQRIEAIKPDFDKINLVIESLVNEVQNELTQIWWPMRIIDNVSNEKDEAVINFSIKMARNFAWKLATDTSNLSATELPAFIESTDKGLELLAKKIISPGIWLSLILKVIRITERQKVEDIIKILNR